MTISDHVAQFGGHPIVLFDPDKGLRAPDKNAIKLALDWDDKVPFAEVLARFLSDPLVGQVSSLVIGTWGDEYEASSASVVEALVAASDKLSGLRALFLGDITFEECEISWIQQSDVTPLLLAFPGLEEFRVRGGQGLQFGRPRHENLRSLTIESGGLDAAVVRAVLASELPNLEHLELWLGDDAYGATATLDDLAPLLQGDLFPRLRYLGLRDSCMADQLATVLADAPVLDRVEVLDLSLGVLSGVGGRALAASSRLGSLKKLDIHHHYVPEAVVASMARPGLEIDTSDAKEPDDDGTSEDRYVAVSE